MRHGGDQASNLFQRLKANDWIAAALSIIAIIVATASALFTNAQAETGRDTEKRQLRSYVEPYLSQDPITRDPASEAPMIVVDVRNYGQTPAYEVHLDYAIMLNDSAAIMLPQPIFGPAANTTIAPNQIVKYRIPVPMADLEEKRQAFADGTAWITLRVTVRYDDVFGDSHHSPICELITADPGATDGHSTSCTRYDRSD